MQTITHGKEKVCHNPSDWNSRLGSTGLGQDQVPKPPDLNPMLIRGVATEDG